MQPDDELSQLHMHWPEPALPAGLAERIIRTARVQPQWQPWWVRITLSLGSWNSGWNVKGAAFAAVAAIGLLSGQLGAVDTGRSPLETPGMTWSEGL